VEAEVEAEVSALPDVCALHWHVRERARLPTPAGLAARDRPALLPVQPPRPPPENRRSPFYPPAPRSLALVRAVAEAA
jgi:hypothetical protein